jgi:hypothetical protein
VHYVLSPAPGNMCAVETASDLSWMDTAVVACPGDEERRAVRLMARFDGARWDLTAGRWHPIRPRRHQDLVVVHYVLSPAPGNMCAVLRVLRRDDPPQGDDPYLAALCAAAAAGPATPVPSRPNPAWPTERVQPGLPW